MSSEESGCLLLSDPTSYVSQRQKSNLHLPSEVLSHIFSYLPISGKRNARLTCSQWYDAGNALSLIRNERMVVRPITFNNYEVFKTLMDCPRLRFDIEFCGVRFLTESLLFWQKCGSRINSLKLVDCSFVEESAIEMIKLCTNLKTLHFCQCNNIFDYYHSIQKNHADKIEQNRLISLILEDCYVISDCDLTMLFDIYPHIQNFQLKTMDVNCYKLVDSRFYKIGTRIFNSDLIFTFTCVFTHIASNAATIKTIHLDTIGDNGLTDDWLTALGSLQALKLKELVLHHHPLVHEETFLKFFSNQTTLTSVRVSKCPNFSLRCFLRLIKNCVNLEAICIESSDIRPDFSTSKELLSTLISLPHLKSLELLGFFIKKENIDRITLENNGFFNKLKSLTLRMPEVYCDIFIRRSPLNLSVLHLFDKSGNSGLTNENLRFIFERLIHLRSLTASLHFCVTDFGFVGFSLENHSGRGNNGVSISRLKRLEKLCLGFKDCVKHSLTEISFSHFVFPNLRELKLINFGNVSSKSYELLSESTPSLEYLELNQSWIESSVLLTVCERWKSLRGLILKNAGDISVSTIIRVQKFCPALKFYQLDNYPLVFVDT